MGRSLAPKPVIVEGVPRFKRPTAKGVGLRVADFRTGNHPEDDFTPFETIRRLCSVFGRRSQSGFEGETSEPKGRVRHQAPQSNVIAYGDEPTVNLLRSFLNLGRAGGSLTLSNRGSVVVPITVVKPITHLADWKDNFFYVENKIIPSDYPELLLESNKFDKKIFWGQGLKTSWKHCPKEPVIYYRGQKMDGEFKFLSKGCIDNNQCSPSSKFVNNEAPVIDTKTLTSVHPSDFVKDVVDSDDASAGDNENPLVGTSLPPLPEAGKKVISLGKRKLPSGVGDSLSKVQKMVAQASKVDGEASDPLDVDSDPDIDEFPSAKESRTRELISTLYKATTSCDVIRARELEKDRAYAELEKKCNEALPWIRIHWLLICELRLRHCRGDRASVVAKVVLDAAIKLICSDEIGMLVAKLVKASIIYGRWAAFEEVAKLKEPFIMEKMAGYRPSSKQECDQDGDDLANALYPFLSKYVNDPYASLEQLLSKKLETLRSNPSYVKAK
nr:hypothetical protein [Tanacetum cinerariifolium]